MDIKQGNLVLTIPEGGSLKIGEAVVTIGKVRGKRVKIVISAPRSVPVVRGGLQPRAEAA